MSIKDRARAFIASRNGGFIAGTLASMADKYLKAYRNLGNMNMSCNGEVDALRLIFARFAGEVMDVGANEGQWARAVLPIIGKTRMHIFEPIPQTYAILQEAMDKYDNVVLVNMGLGEKEKLVTFNFNCLVSDMASAYPIVDHQEGSVPVECRITTGDAYINENNISSVSLLKIDVEGMEADCLAGFEKSFDSGLISCVQFEHGPFHVHSGHNLKFFIDWFGERNFEVYEIFPNRLKPLCYQERTESYVGQNLLAVRRDLKGQLGL